MSEVTRGEFDMLKQQVFDNGRRLDSIDATGTRGVAVLQLQITDLAKDFATHEERHEQWESRRLSGRRWLVGTVIALVALVETPLGVIMTVLLTRR